MTDEPKPIFPTQGQPATGGIGDPSVIIPPQNVSERVNTEADRWKAHAYDELQASGTKAHVISISTKYLTLELDEPTNLQQGQSVRVSKA